MSTKEQLARLGMEEGWLHNHFQNPHLEAFNLLTFGALGGLTEVFATAILEGQDEVAETITRNANIDKAKEEAIIAELKAYRQRKNNG